MYPNLSDRYLIYDSPTAEQADHRSPDGGAGCRAGVRIFGRSAGGSAAFAPRHPDPAFCQQCRLGGRLAADAPTAL